MEKNICPRLRITWHSFTCAPASMNTDTERDGPLISRLLALHRRQRLKLSHPLRPLRTADTSMHKPFVSLCVRERRRFFLRFSARPYARFARVTRETASPFLKAASIMRVKGEKRNVSSHPWKLCGRYTFHAFLSTPFHPLLRPHTLAHP